MALLSPGIQIFESSSTPAATAVAAENGVATLGFSTRGPANKLVKVNSIDEFVEIFGEPIKNDYFAHILTQAVLANNTDAYFMRVIDENTAKYAKCPVVDFEIKGVKVAIKDSIAKLQSGYFMALWKAKEGSGALKPSVTPTFRVTLSYNYKDEDTLKKKVVNVDVPMHTPTATFGPAGTYDKTEYPYVLWIPVSDVVDALAKSELKDVFKFTEVGRIDDVNPEIGMLITAKNEKMFDANLPLEFSFDIGEPSEDAFSSWITGESVNDTANEVPVALTSDTFADEELRTESTLEEFVSNGLDAYNHFELTAKYFGSSMDNFKIVKTSSVSVTGKESWTVSVYDGNSTNAIESRTFEPKNLENFVKEMGKFTYVDVEAGTAELGTELEDWTWKDGTWVLGYGELLGNGEYWGDDVDTSATPIYIVQKGDDGYPLVDLGNGPQYSEAQARVIYLNALGSDDLVNVDEYSFSILAIPGCQNVMVQNAAIEVCATRGDAIFLADVPEELCHSKVLVDDVVEWANGNSGFQSSYCAIYYGWFAQTNPYDPDNSIFCPASCFIAPKMVALDQSNGEFFAPAGLTRGTLICSDWLYSPDQKDRDKLVGNDNVVNPISYSNTRGVTIMAQKTTDRSTSPLNRVGIRRMTNMIKRNLRSRLYALLFEPNNEVARSRARTIVDDIMSGLRTSECIESYDINVTSGTGAARNELNVYLSYAPYGLIEKIYVYLSITDAGVEVTETVA